MSTYLKKNIKVNELVPNNYSRVRGFPCVVNKHQHSVNTDPLNVCNCVYDVDYVITFTTLNIYYILPTICFKHFKRFSFYIQQYNNTTALLI